MIRKIQAQKNLRYVFIPIAFIETLGIEKGQKVDVRLKDKMITISLIGD